MTGDLKTGTLGVGSSDGTSPTKFLMNIFIFKNPGFTVDITIRLMEAEDQGSYENNG